MALTPQEVHSLVRAFEERDLDVLRLYTVDQAGERFTPEAERALLDAWESVGETRQLVSAPVLP